MPEAKNNPDPTYNVRELIDLEIERIDDLRKAEVRRIDEKINENNVKYQIQFSDSKEAVGTAFIAQEKAIAAALIGTKEAITKSDQVTKEAITKADTTTDKRFDLLSEKIDSIAETISKNTGAQGIYVTHEALSNEMEKLRLSFESMLRPVITFMNSQQGKETIADPRMDTLMAKVELLNTVQNTNTGKSAGIGMSWQTMVTAIALCGTLISIFFALSK